MAIDFSPLLNTVPGSGASRGMQYFGDALDAVIARRDRLAAEKRAADHQAAIEAQQQAQLAEQERHARQLEAATTEKNRVDAEHEKAAAGRLSRTQDAATMKEMYSLAHQGQPDAAVSYGNVSGFQMRPKADAAIGALPPLAPDQSANVTGEEDGAQWTGQNTAASEREQQIAKLREQHADVYDVRAPGAETGFDLNLRALTPERRKAAALAMMGPISDPAQAAATNRILGGMGAGLVGQDKAQAMIEADVQGRARDAAALDRAHVVASKDNTANKRLDLEQATHWVPDPDTGKPLPAANVKGEEVVAARKAHEALTGLGDWKKRMSGFVAKHGIAFNDYDPRISQEWNALASEAAAYLTQMNQSGVLNEGEFKRYRAMVAPDGLRSLVTTPGALDRSLNQVLAGAKGRYVGMVRTLIPTYKSAAQREAESFVGEEQ